MGTVVGEIWEVPNIAIWRNGALKTASTRVFYEMHKTNTVIDRCVATIQKNTAVNKFYVVDEENEVIEWTRAEAILKNSNFRDLKNRILLHNLIGGTVFVEKEKNDKQQIGKLSTVDPRTMTIVATSQGDILRYVQRTNKGHTVEFYIDEMSHFYDDPDPDSDLFWRSNCQTLVNDVFWDLEASRSNYSFFLNDATPPGILVVDGTGYTTEQINEAVKSLTQSMSGGANKHRLLYSSILKDIKTISQSHKDMDFINQRKFTIEQVASAFDVPKFMLGHVEGVNYSNGREMRANFMENTIQPIERWLEDVFTSLVCDPGQFIKIESAETRDRTVLINNTIARVDGWLITRNEAREILWDPIIEDNELMDEYTVKVGTMRLEDVIVADPIDPSDAES